MLLFINNIISYIRKTAALILIPILIAFVILNISSVVLSDPLIKSGRTVAPLKLRNGPGVDTDTIGYIRKGIVVDIIGEEGNWYNVVTPNGNEGWTSSNFIAPPDFIIMSGIRVLRNVDAHELPGRGIAIRFTISPDQTLKVLNIRNGWYMVQLDTGKWGWIPAGSLSIETEKKLVPEEVIPEEVIPEEIVPEETVPEETVPEETVPQDIAPEDVVPEPEPSVPEQVPSVPEQGPIIPEQGPPDAAPELSIIEKVMASKETPEEKPPVSLFGRFYGSTKKGFVSFIYAYNYVVLIYFLSLSGIYILMNILSFIEVRRYIKKTETVDLKRIFRSSFYKPISILAPAYNEEATVAASTKSLLQLQYPEFEVVIINDGSGDDTLDVLIKNFGLKKVFRIWRNVLKTEMVRGVYLSSEYPNLIVVDKENGGKADALNAGINIARYPIICNINSDSLLEYDSLLKVARPFIENPETVAVGGVVRIVNNCKVRAGNVEEINMPKSHLARFQVVEYLRAFLFGRVGWNLLNSMMVISGAFGAFSKKIVLECGGYRHDTVGEDMELVVRIHRLMREKRRKYKITFIPDPVCWTEVPESLKDLGRQRRRWQRGLMETLKLNRKMLFNPGYGVAGMFAIPYFYIFEALSPIIEVTGIIVFIFSWMFGIVNLKFAMLFLSAAIILGMTLSLGAVVLEELSFRRYPKMSHLLILFVYAFLESFSYRFIYLWWRLKGLWDHVTGKGKYLALRNLG